MIFIRIGSPIQWRPPKLKKASVDFIGVTSTRRQLLPRCLFLSQQLANAEISHDFLDKHYQSPKRRYQYRQCDYYAYCQR